MSEKQPTLNGLSHPEMVKRLAKNATQIAEEIIDRENRDQLFDLLHASIGFAGEVCELQEGAVTLSTSADDNLVEELGDIEFYLELLRQCLNIKVEAVTEERVCNYMSFRSLLDELSELSGDMLDATKKCFIYNQEIDMTRFVIALTKTNLCLSLIYKNKNITREDVLEANLKKLDKRYPGFNFTNEAAKARKDKA